MKKLKLKALELSAKEILSREQMKFIVGGGNGSCAATFTTASGSGNTVEVPDGVDLVYEDNNNGTVTYTIYGADYNGASGYASDAGSGARWCCDSCSDASWYNPPSNSK